MGQRTIAGSGRGRTQYRLHHVCGIRFLLSVPKDPVGWMERMIEDGECDKCQDPLVCGEWGTLWWGDGGSVNETSYRGEFCSEDAICEHAGCYRRRRGDIVVYARRMRGRGRGRLGENVEWIVAGIYVLWGMFWWHCGGVWLVMANGGDGESGDVGEWEVVLEGGRGITGARIWHRLAVLERWPGRACVGVVLGGHDGG